MADDNAILDAALEYLDMGFSVIPVRRDKKPLIKWTEYQARHATESEVISWWEQWPDANVAIITGAISGIFCVDADGPEGCAWVDKHCPKTGVYSVTSPGKLHSIFKIPEGSSIKNAVRLAPEVDIRGYGGYFVAPPSTHAGGHQYQWRYIMDGWGDLTEWEPKSNGHKPAGNIQIDLSTVSTTPINEPVSIGQRNSTLAQLAGKWIGQGMEDKEILALAQSWNMQNTPPLGEKELITVLKSIRKTHIQNHPTEQYQPKPQQPAIIPTATSIPGGILEPGGMLSEIMQYISDNSAVSVPYFSLAAAITLVGNVAGQKIQTETGLRTNIYAVAIGYSGSGKDAAFDAIPNLLIRSEAAKTIGPDELTSSTSVLRWLQQAPAALMTIDEIGILLKGLKNPNSPASDVPRILLKLFSGTNRPIIKNYASGEIISIPWCHLSFYGASTPQRFWDSLTPGEVTDGFLGRILIFESLHDALLPKTKPFFHESPSLLDSINRITNIKVTHDQSRGNIEHVPIPKMIPKTPEAQAYFEPWAIGYHNLRNQYQNDVRGLSAIYGRVAEHAHKLALIHAVSMYEDQVRVVDLDSVKWACDLMDYLSANMIQQISNNVAETETHRWKQKIVNGIRDISMMTEYQGATIRDIQRGPCRGLLAKDIDNLIKSLLLGEEIGQREVSRKNGQKSVVFYCSAQGVTNE